MLKQIFLLGLVMLFFSNDGFSQKGTVTCDRFFELLNTYDKVGLQNLLSNNFKLKRGFTNYENEKTSFLGKYLTYSKEINAKFIVLGVISKKETATYLVQDESDYLKYLEIKAPRLKWFKLIQPNLLKCIVVR